MGTTTFKPVKRQSVLIPEGLYLATVVDVANDKSSSNTPQIRVVFENNKGIKRTSWFNLRGYKSNSEGDFLDKKGNVIDLYDEEGEKLIGDDLAKQLAKRVEDPAKTEECYRIFGEFLDDLDIEEEVEATDESLQEHLIGRTCLIGIITNGMYTYVRYTFNEANEAYAEKVMTKALGYNVELA